MIIAIPDPHPGRCLNIRNGDRCLDYDHHDGSCRFGLDHEHELWWQVEHRSWSIKATPPVPWVSPVGEETS